jgi:hypothetical protein
MAENSSNRTVMILAGAVVILLIAFVAVVVLNSNAGTNTAANTGTTGTTGTAAATATSNPGVGSSAAAAFDPATATKVTGTPKAFVAAYYQSILDKKFDVAFKMQPKASQTGTVADFQSTQEMYGMKAFAIFSEVTGSTEATVVIRQDLGTNGIWNATWTFAKADGSWLVKERKVGMGEPTK